MKKNPLASVHSKPLYDRLPVKSEQLIESHDPTDFDLCVDVFGTLLRWKRELESDKSNLHGGCNHEKPLHHC